MTAAVAEHDAIPTHLTAVARTQRLSDRFVRVTFRGGLDRFSAAGPDQFAYVLLPPPGRRELTVGTDFRWSHYDDMPEAQRPVGAYYTVRHHRPDAGEIDCDVYLHEPPGHASAWAAVAQPGASAALWGPRTAWAPPPATNRWLLVADETGVPATEAVLASRPPGTAVTVVVEISSLDDVAHAEFGDAIYADRGAGRAGTTDVLVEAVRSLDLDPRGLYAWGGAESRAMRDVRHHLRHKVGLAREQVSMTAYWRFRA